MSGRRDRTAGITLVEMLVALVIFALVGLASFATLDTIIRVRDRTEGRMEQIARIDRALRLFSRDVAQSRPGGTRAEGGSLSVARFGSDPLVWRLDGTILLRQAGSSVGEGFEQSLLGGVAGVAFRFADAAGDWHPDWPVEGADVPLIGVEMQLDLGADGVVLRLAEVPAGVGG